MSCIFDRNKAVQYARKYAKSPNPTYTLFRNDCTNFVSQAMQAGGWTFVGEQSFWERKSDDVWWYGGSWLTDASYTWGGAQNFYNFLKNSGRGRLVSKQSHLEIGDVVQLSENGHVYHTMIVTGGSDATMLLSYHTSNTLDAPLPEVLERSGSGVTAIYWKIVASC